MFGFTSFWPKAFRNALECIRAREGDEARSAAYSSRNPERINSCNSHRKLSLLTSAGALKFDIPKLRRGTLFACLLLDASYAKRRVKGCSTSQAAVITIVLDFSRSCLPTPHHVPHVQCSEPYP